MCIQTGPIDRMGVEEAYLSVESPSTHSGVPVEKQNICILLALFLGPSRIRTNMLVSASGFCVCLSTREADSALPRA